MSKVVSQTSKFFHRSSYSNSIQYMQKISKEKFMKMNIIEDKEQEESENYLRIIKSLFNQVAPKVHLRLSLAQLHIDQFLRFSTNFKWAHAIFDDNKVMNFYHQHCEGLIHLDAGELYQELNIAKIYQISMRRFQKEK